MIENKVKMEIIERAKHENFEFRAGHPLLSAVGFEKATEEDLMALAKEVQRRTPRTVTLFPCERNTSHVVGFTPKCGYALGNPIYNGSSQKYWEVHVW